MCGIFGLIKKPKDKVIPEEITEPLRVLAHRGPDGTGTFIQRNVGLGHNRLSIFDLSEEGAQPMTKQSYTITFNGAIYNFPELKKELIDLGYSFQSQTDTEVILAAYDSWGTDCVQRFNGQWAFAIHDEKRGQLFCSRDRFGIKPFYYTWIDGKFCLASEIKAFTKVKGWRAKLNRVRAYEYLVYGYHDHTSETLFDGVHQLPKGHHLIFNLKNHKHKIAPYYKLEKTITSPLTFPEATEQFQSLFEDAVHLRLRSDTAVGSALSGGLDSSSIVATIHKTLAGRQIAPRQSTLSACFPGFKKDESRWVDIMTNQFALNAHKVYPSGADFLENIKHLTWIQDEPLAGASLYAQYEVFKAARSLNIPVMLDGQGADEILGGYDKFYLPFFKQLVRKKPWRVPSEIFHYFQKHQITPGQAWAAFQQFRKKSTPQHPQWLNPDFTVQASERFNRSPENSIHQTSLNSFYEMGLSALLHYEDRNAMASGIESRLPFLDHRLVEFCISLPDPYKIHKGIRKRILRSAMQDQLPEAIVNRFDKIGFAAPEEVWVASENHNIQKQFSKLKAQYPDIFNIDRSYPATRKSQWSIISFGLWLEKFSL